MTTTHSSLSLRTEVSADVEFQRLLKGSSEQRELMVSFRSPRGFPDLISEDFESKLSFKTQTTIIPFFPINPKHPQSQCPVKKCIQVC